ncbi:hypothetical protein Ngar_c05230 [Candidatus Nitrososphaera gargensis Ga9.2]|uniref:Uncharacterized protein n=1 Tax=Nitrososphaera gargensis (strain Ga9.2) TaxID=1237085 RepID=K0I870_NITGG|nr:hypothetical protein Ngar_c05230 [Candidatus Nitrososphaera gargensis Ga9.2]
MCDWYLFLILGRLSRNEFLKCAGQMIHAEKEKNISQQQLCWLDGRI